MTDLLFVWDNFGPLHVDRCEAVARKFEGKHRVVGLELAGRSKNYDWVPETGSNFVKHTVFQDRAIEDVSFFNRFWFTLRNCISYGRGAKIFMCHYQDPAILAASLTLRLLGREVFAIGCSKFDDYSRKLRREVLKSLFYIPYVGGIASGIRSRDYMRFLGVPTKRLATPYNTVSLDRIRKLSGVVPAPDGVPFAERHFTIVARLVPKKNISMAITAMAMYASQVKNPRHLHIFGGGPLESSLREQAKADGVDHLIHFRGFLQTAEISRNYGTTLALLLPSIEEQFGNVVPEALALGLPIILSDNCGARDELVRSGDNGFVIEPDNPTGLAFFMQLLSEDEALWRRFSLASAQFAYRADSGRFAEAVEKLITPAVE